MKSLKKGIVKEIKPIGQVNRSLVRSMIGERIVFRVLSTHLHFRYDYHFGCRPKKKEDCGDCPYKFECFTISDTNQFDNVEELIQIKFEGSTIGIFPSYWRTPSPTSNELEAYLWGESNGRLQLRSVIHESF